MECLPFDWKSIDVSFEKDDFYENIQAPKWIDFTTPSQPVDDHAWFCSRAGCADEGKKSVLHAFYQENEIYIEAPKAPASVVAPVANPTARVRVFNSKNARGVVSSSLSSLTALKASYAKDKVAYHTQLPAIGECKGGPARNVRQQQASENENPNRSCKAQHGASKKLAEFVETKSKEKKSKILTAISTTLPQLSQTQPILEARKSTFVFGERHPSYAKSGTFCRDAPSVYASVSGAKILKAGGTRTISRLQSTPRNPHLMASLTMPLRKSTTNARHLNGGASVGSDKIAACKPIRVTKDVKVAVSLYSCRKRSDCKEEGNSMRMDNLKGKKQIVHTGLPLKALQGVVGEVMFNDVQTRAKEDSIQNTLDKFLQNLRHTSHEDEAQAVLNVGTDATSVEQGTKQTVVNESLKEEIVVEHDEEKALEQEMVQSMSTLALNGSKVTALQTSGNVVLDGRSDQKHDLKVEDWQRQRGTKRKSSELNLRRNHDSREHKHKTQMVPRRSQPLKQFTSTAKLHVMACGSKDSCGKHHKKMMKTSIAPFRLRTEERGALKGLELAKKEPSEPNSKDVLHHALQMPSFGHPFKPKRSTKKLTIPKEPKFHLSKTRKGDLASN